MIERTKHWNSIYQKKSGNDVSWYQPHLAKSLDLVLSAGLRDSAAIIDVGGGVSTFVDDLLDAGFSDVTIVDISSEAIEKSRTRLGEKSLGVNWRCADITDTPLEPVRYDLWHDRAVFHFLTDPADRSTYVAVLKRALKPNGHVVIATFGPNGPGRCSGLEVVRYSAEDLQSTLGEEFRLKKDLVELHTTPTGAQQEFQYCLFEYVRGNV